MGAFQSSYQSAEVSDALDLTLEATVSNGALPPRYETPSASQFSLFANETVTLNGREWVPVRTGLSFKMPFMLILLVRGTGQGSESPRGWGGHIHGDLMKQDQVKPESASWRRFCSRPGFAVC